MKRLLPLLLGVAAVFGLEDRALPQKATQKAATKKATPPPAPKAAPKKGDGDDPALQQFEAQFGRQFRHLHRSELHFMRLVCQPTKQQYQKIAADSGVGLKATIKQFAGYLREQQQGRWSPTSQADPREAIAQVVVKSARATLSSDQAARFQKEIDERAAALKRAVVLNLVAMMDKTLILNAEQRGKLRDVLERNWNDSWSVYVITGGGYYFPSLPDAKIAPILTATQKTVWQGVPKGNVYYGFRLGMVNMNSGDIDPWDEPEPAAKPQPQKVQKK
jgi:hypothetical protein